MEYIYRKYNISLFINLRCHIRTESVVGWTKHTQRENIDYNCRNITENIKINIRFSISPSDEYFYGFFFEDHFMSLSHKKGKNILKSIFGLYRPFIKYSFYASMPTVAMVLEGLTYICTNTCKTYSHKCITYT